MVREILTLVCNFFTFISELIRLLTLGNLTALFKGLWMVFQLIGLQIFWVISNWNSMINLIDWDSDIKTAWKREVFRVFAFGSFNRFLNFNIPCQFYIKALVLRWILIFVNFGLIKGEIVRSFTHINLRIRVFFVFIACEARFFFFRNWVLLLLLMPTEIITEIFFYGVLTPVKNLFQRLLRWYVWIIGKILGSFI